MVSVLLEMLTCSEAHLELKSSERAEIKPAPRPTRALRSKRREWARQLKSYRAVQRRSSSL